MSARRMSTPHLLVGGGHLSEFFTPAQWRTVRTMSLIIVLIWPPSRAATVIAGKAKSRCKSSDVLDCGLFLPRSCLPQTYPDRSWGLWFCWIYTSITCFNKLERLHILLYTRMCLIVAFYRAADGATYYYDRIRFQTTNGWTNGFDSYIHHTIANCIHSLCSVF